MKDRAIANDFDWPLLAIVGAISLLGVLEIYSSTHASGMAGMQWKQLIWIGIGLAGSPKDALPGSTLAVG